MTNSHTIVVIDSFNLTSFGIIAELKHYFNGLPDSTILKSKTNNKEWRVKKRILYCHTIDRQKIFIEESVTHSHINFKSIEGRILSIKKILDREANNIFEYQLEPIGHNSKPEKG